MSKSIQELPGPGNYEDKNNFGKTGGPKFTFNGKPNRKDFTVSPGPAAYDGDNGSSQVRPGQHSARIGTAERNTGNGLLFGSSRDDTSLPGPGLYDAKSSLGGPKFVIGADKRLRD